MTLKHYLITTTFLCLVNSLASAAVVKSIDFESETIGALPSTSTTDSSKITNINFGNPLIDGDAANKYLMFDQSDLATYDQIRVGTYASQPSVRFTFDMFLGDPDATARLFFDNPTIQRFDFFGNGTISAYNVDPASKDPGPPITYSNIYSNTFDVSSYDFTQWHNYIFDIDYGAELVDVYIDETLAFSASIFSQTAGTNSVRFTTAASTGKFGVDNLLLETDPAPLQFSVPEASSIYLLAFGLLGLFGVVRRKV